MAAKGMAYSDISEGYTKYRRLFKGEYSRRIKTLVLRVRPKDISKGQGFVPGQALTNFKEEWGLCLECSR